MRVLLCPDKFRGTASADQVGAALMAGWRRVREDDVFAIVPMADGGEGTLEALATGSQRRSSTVTGPLGDPIEASWGLRSDRTAIIETAASSGLALLHADRRDPRRTTTRGVGELLLAALDAGALRVLVCLGGSATNDGGAGMASALGVRFSDDRGTLLRDGGTALSRLARIDVGGLDRRIPGLHVTGLCDVANPLTGPAGASATYGPQKGATEDMVWELDRALEQLASVVERDLGVDPSREPGAGAAGGLGFGLVAFAGGRLRPGVEAVAEAVGLDQQIANADLVVTGEGAFDETSTMGKVVGGVLGAAALANVPAAVVCGRASLPAPEGVGLLTLVDLVGETAAVGDTRRSLERAGEELATRVGA